MTIQEAGKAKVKFWEYIKKNNKLSKADIEQINNNIAWIRKEYKIK